MTSKVYSVSIPEELAEFVEADPDLKLSKILQTAIIRIMEDYQENPYIQRLLKKIKILEDLQNAQT